MSTEGRRSAGLRHDAKRKAGIGRCLRERARAIVRAMVRRGQLVKSVVCLRCRKRRRTIWHHPDYSRPTWVEETCLKCHRGLHPRGGLFGGGVK